MTIEEKAKAYDEALERLKPLYEQAKKDDNPIWSTYEYLVPELKESEDERIRKVIYKLMLGMREEIFTSQDEIVTKKKVLAYLEKQKEPVVDKEGMYYYLGRKFIYCGYPAMEENPYDFAISQQEKQAEPHYTKRNELFDKCVENCDPKTVEEVNKRVDDIINMPELSAFEQALTNFIGYWEDDEERWPSKFVKKHGKHILDMAREELQKEQIPYTDFVIKPHKGDDNNPYDMRVSEAQEYAIKRGFGIPFNDGEVYVDERYMTQTIGNILRWADEHPKEQKVPNCCLKCNEYEIGYKAGYEHGCTAGYNKAMKEVEEQKEQKPVQSDEEREYVKVLKSLISDFIHDNYKTTDISFYQQIYDWLDGRHIEQKPIEIKIDNPNIQKFDPDVKVTTSDSSASGKELLYVSNKSYNIGYRDGVNSVKPAKWNEEDERIFKGVYGKIDHDQSYNVSKIDMLTWLKSLRPQSQDTYQRVVHTIFNMLKDKDFYEIQPSNRVSLLNDIRVKCKDAIECAPILDEPSWKPSEDEERLINTSISFLKDFADKGYENAVECIDWLKSKLNGNTCE